MATINDLEYLQTPTMFGDKAIPHKTMLNTFEDAFHKFKKILH